MYKLCFLFEKRIVVYNNLSCWQKISILLQICVKYASLWQKSLNLKFDEREGKDEKASRDQNADLLG